METSETIERGNVRLRIVRDTSPHSPFVNDDAWGKALEAVDFGNKKYYSLRQSMGYRDTYKREKGYSIMYFSYGYDGEIEESAFDDADGCFVLDHEKWANYAGVRVKSPKHAMQLLRSLVYEVQAWAVGNVYGFIVDRYFERKGERFYTKKDGMDSCWGFYGAKSIAWMEGDFPKSFGVDLRKISKRMARFE